MKVRREVLPALAIIVICIASAVVYGIVHDQFTARICVEYFTIGHPPIFKTDSPTLLAIGWGVIATWWVGVVLGIPLAVAARLGKRPKIAPGQLARPIAMLLVVMAACACLAGLTGYVLATGGTIRLLGTLGERVPEDRHVAYLTAAFAHSTSYLVGLLGGMIVVIQTWRQRRLLEIRQVSQPGLSETWQRK